MTATTEPGPSRRRWWKWLAALVLAVLILWVGYWFVSRHLVVTAFGRAAESLAGGGRDVGCATSALGGFPLRLDLDCAHLAFDDRNAGTAVAAAGITATAPLYRPGLVDAVVTGPVTVDIPERGLSLSASWENATATIHAGLGGLGGATVVLDQVEVVPGTGPNRMPFSRASADQATVSALPGAGDDYRFTFDADGIVVVRDDGESLPAMMAAAEVTALQFGRSLGANPIETVADWLMDGGELQVDRFALTMGDATAGATGRLRASAEGVLSGELTVRIVGLDQVPALAESLGLGSKDRLTRIVGMASAITRPVAGNPAARDVPVTIRNGVARVGLIPLGTIPALRP